MRSPSGVVYAAYLKVTENQGAAGVDGQSVEEFEQDLSGNLFKIWNRMSSGSYRDPGLFVHWQFGARLNGGSRLNREVHPGSERAGG